MVVRPVSFVKEGFTQVKEQVVIPNFSTKIGFILWHPRGASQLMMLWARLKNNNFTMYAGIRSL